MFSDLLIPISYADSAFAVLLALAVLVFKRGKLSWALFAFGMVLLAIEAGLAAAMLESSSLSEILLLQKFNDMASTLSMPAWLIFSICYSRANYRAALN